MTTIIYDRSFGAGQPGPVGYCPSDTHPFSVILKSIGGDVTPPPLLSRIYDVVGRLPKGMGTLLLCLTSVEAFKIIWQAGMKKRTDAAIQYIYDYKPRPWRLLWGLGDHLWVGLSHNTRSVWLRGQFVKRIIAHLLEEKLQGDTTTLMSLGSGSAAQLLSGIKASSVDHSKLNVVLVDRDSVALSLAENRVAEMGLGLNLLLEEQTVGRLLKQYVEDGKTVDLVEAMGFFDYTNDNRFVQYTSRIASVLNERGFFIGANITSTQEENFRVNAAQWPKMFYRSEEYLYDVLSQAGFSAIWIGQCGLYTLWVAQK